MDEFKLDIDKLKEKISIVFEKHPEIIIAYLFGSSVKNKFHKFSDIDIGLVLVHNKEIDSLYPVEIRYKLEDITGNLIKRPFDIRILNDASPKFLNQAVRHGILIYYKDQDFKDEYELKVLHEYFDIKPILEIFEKNYIKLNLGENIE